MNAPRLRFKGFKTDWVEKSLSQISDIKTGPFGSALHEHDYVDEGTPIITVEHLGDGSIQHVNLPLVSEEDKTRLRSYLLKPEDIVFSRVGSVDRSCLVSKKEDGWLFSGRLLRLRVTDTNTSPSFLNQNFKTRLNKHRIRSVAVGQTMASLNTEILKKFTLHFPETHAEQLKISSLLSLFDEKITQLTKRHELLIQYKKGVMQKIFNQEIRFKNDVSGQYPDWETKSLGDIGTFQTSSIDKLTKDNERKVFLVNYMNVYRHENINNNSIKSFQIVSAKDSQIQSCNLKMGDILFTPSSETPDDIGHSVVISEDLDRAVYSYHLMRFRPKIKIDIKYSHYFCNTQNVLAQLTRLATGATRFTISIKSFSTIQVQLPCIEEQQKIASLFIKLDEKISNVHKQLELTKQYKQGLLQQMFV